MPAKVLRAESNGISFEDGVAAAAESFEFMTADGAYIRDNGELN